VKYHESLFEVLAKQYEAAKIDEAKESPAIQVLDPAVPPEKRSSPRRTQLVIITTALAIIGGLLYVCNEAAIKVFLARINEDATGARVGR
jgi:uncharacterized protein involved in exopolysaccharide biosynthesis